MFRLLRRANARAKTILIMLLVLLAGVDGLVASHSTKGWPVDLPSTTTETTSSTANVNGVVETGSVELTGTRGNLTFYNEPPPPPPNATAPPPPVSGPMIIDNTTYVTPTNPSSTLNAAGPAITGNRPYVSPRDTSSSIHVSADPPVNVWRNIVVATISNIPTFMVPDSPEPSVAANGTNIFYTWNYGACLSNDGGKTCPFLNPFNDINGNMAWSFRGDPDVIFAPQQQVFLWYRQACGGALTSCNINPPPKTQMNILSVVTASGYACDFTFGPSTEPKFDPRWWFDYPQLALGNRFLYLTTNMFGGNTNQGTLAIRFPLAQLAGCAAGTSVSISLDWTWLHYNGCGDICGFLSMAPVDRAVFVNGWMMFFAAHLSNSVLRVFSWPESGGARFDDVVHPPFQPAGRGTASCPVSDGTDPCNFFDSRVLGGLATQSNGVADWLYFYWNANQGNGFPFPWTYAIILNPLNPTYCPVNCVIQIWSKTNALVFASVTPNLAGDFLGVSLVAAGGTTFPSTALATITPLDLLGGKVSNSFTISDPGTNGPTSNRWGDFSWIRPYFGDPKVRWGGSWVASGFRKTNPTTFEFHVYFLSPKHIPPTIAITYPTDGAVVDLTPGHASPDFTAKVTDPQGLENCLSMINLAWHSDVDAIFFENSCDLGATLPSLGKLLTPGVQHIFVTATDKEGEPLTSNTVTFTLVLPSLTVVITNPANNQQIPQGAQMTLQGVAYWGNQQQLGVPPVDCNQLSWSWSGPSGIIGGACSGNGKTFQVAYTFKTIEQVTLTLVANYGKVTGSATVIVNVVAPSSAVFVTIDQTCNGCPYNTQTYYAPNGLLQLTGTVSGGTGTYPTITWEADWSSGTYTITTGALSYSWNVGGTLCQLPNFTPAYAGTLPVTIKLTATDSNGNSGSASVSLNIGCTVIGAINVPLSSPNPINDSGSSQLADHSSSTTAILVSTLFVSPRIAKIE